jgi:hypothetical protein
MREVWPRNWGSLGAAEWMIIGFEGVLFWGSFWWVLILIGYVCLCRVRTDNRAILGIRARARREMRRGRGTSTAANSFERRQLTDKVSL